MYTENSIFCIENLQIYKKYLNLYNKIGDVSRYNILGNKNDLVLNCSTSKLKLHKSGTYLTTYFRAIARLPIMQ